MLLSNDESKYITVCVCTSKVLETANSTKPVLVLN